jgi:hypothetical protein
MGIKCNTSATEYPEAGNAEMNLLEVEKTALLGRGLAYLNSHTSSISRAEVSPRIGPRRDTVHSRPDRSQTG